MNRRNLFRLVNLGWLNLAPQNLKGAQDKQATKPAAGGKSATRTTAFTPAGGFDWRRVSARRTVFTVDYWPGLPGVIREGRPDMSSDIEHFKAYADPVTVRTLQVSLRRDPRNSTGVNRGWFDLPDLLNSTPAQIRKWQQEIKAKLEPLFEQYRRGGVYCLDLQTLFNVSGRDNSPDWYHTVPDWEECDLGGTPLSKVKDGRPMPCLTHSKMYEMIDRSFQALSFLGKEPTFLGVHVENEPHLGGRDLSNFGGNPHTQRTLREMLATAYPDVATFNRIAGTSFTSFEQIAIANPNWLVQVWAGRLRSKMVTGIYQTRAAALVKKNIPHAITMTRLETGYWLGEHSGKHEINGVEFTYLKDSDIDVVSWSHLWNARDPDGFGQLNVTGGLLWGSGKMIGFTEPHALRYGKSQWAVFRPDELQHFIYRGLYYNFRMFNLHSWDREGGWAIYNEPFGAVYTKHQGTLRMVAQLRSELDRSAPYATFGKPVPPPLRLLVSRNARHYPGMGGWFYGNWLARLCKILEQPKFSCYDVLEEQTQDTAAALQQARGIVAVDACLSDETRKQLGDLVAAGGRLLVFGASATVSSHYEPTTLPESYPVDEQREPLADLGQGAVPAPVECRVMAAHPVLGGLSSLKLLRPVPLKLRAGAQALAVTPEGVTAVAANDQVVYFGGFPVELFEQRLLMENFARWCGVEPPAMVVSQFENATVVQNWDTANHRLDGSVLDPTPWRGTVGLHGDHQGQIRELREDHPWLAYHRARGHVVLEGVKLQPKEVRVFRKEAAREMPHFEGIPDTLGFSFWWAGDSHPIIGRFTASRPTEVSARIAGGSWGEKEIAWYVVEIGEKRIAEGTGRDVRFSVQPEREYYLTAVLPNHPGLASCALCLDHAFE